MHINDVQANSDDNTLLRRWLRRAATFSVLTLATTLSLPILLLFSPIAIVRDNRAKRFQPYPAAHLRSIVMFVVWLWMESLGVLIALCLTPARLFGPDLSIRLHRALQQLWIHSLVGAMKRIFDIRIEITGAELVQSRPGVMLVRHSSLLDTLLPALLLTDSNIGLRYVLKRELLFDPCLDLVGCRLPNAFVRRHGDTKHELGVIEQLAQHTPEDETVVIYPEGTRFTVSRRTQLLERLRAKQSQRLALAETLQHTLPPRSGGTLALLKHLDQRPVAIMAHVGFEGAARLKDILGGSLVGRRIAVRMWTVSPEELPDCPELRREWLDAWWERIDQWVDQNLSQPRSTPSPGSIPITAG